MARDKRLVPDGLMQAIGAVAMAMVRKRPGDWTDVQIESMRSSLPAEYHSVPLDWLRTRWGSLLASGSIVYKPDRQSYRKGARAKFFPATCPKCHHFFEVSRSGEAQERLF